MARIFFMAFEKAGQTALVKKLRNSGHKLAITEPHYPEFYHLVKQQSPTPDVFVIDCSTQASHARESCNYLKTLKAYRDVPFLLYNVKKDDEAATLAKVPGAQIIPNDQVEKALVSMGFRAPIAPSPP